MNVLYLWDLSDEALWDNRCLGNSPNPLSPLLPRCFSEANSVAQAGLKCTTYNDRLASSSNVLGLQACTTMCSCWGLNSACKASVLPSELHSGSKFSFLMEGNWDMRLCNCQLKRRQNLWGQGTASGQGYALVVEQVAWGCLWAHNVHLVTHGYNRACVSWPQLAWWWHKEVGLWPRNFDESQNIVKRSEAAHCYLQGKAEGSLYSAWPRPWGCLLSQSIWLIVSSIIFCQYTQKQSNIPSKCCSVVGCMSFPYSFQYKSVNACTCFCLSLIFHTHARLSLVASWLGWGWGSYKVSSEAIFCEPS